MTSRSLLPFLAAALLTVAACGGQAGLDLHIVVDHVEQREIKLQAIVEPAVVFLDTFGLHAQEIKTCREWTARVFDRVECF